VSGNTVIDDEFIAKWDSQYDEGDESEYRCLVKRVRTQVQSLGVISRQTFEHIYDWKAARAKRHVRWKKFRIYTKGLREALRAADDRRVAILDDLPGIGIPVASTLLHFIYPKRFPIVDYRTVEALQDLDCLDKSRSLYSFRDTPEGYGVFRQVMLNIARQHPKWSLRQIDRALFAYHKKELEPKKRCMESSKRD